MRGNMWLSERTRRRFLDFFMIKKLIWDVEPQKSHRGSQQWNHSWHRCASTQQMCCFFPLMRQWHWNAASLCSSKSSSLVWLISGASVWCSGLRVRGFITVCEWWALQPVSCCFHTREKSTRGSAGGPSSPFCSGSVGLTDRHTDDTRPVVLKLILMFLCEWGCFRVQRLNWR